jgi:hypothetical protein
MVECVYTPIHNLHFSIGSNKTDILQENLIFTGKMKEISKKKEQIQLSYFF